MRRDTPAVLVGSLLVASTLLASIPSANVSAELGGPPSLNAPAPEGPDDGKAPDAGKEPTEAPEDGKEPAPKEPEAGKEPDAKEPDRHGILGRLD